MVGDKVWKNRSERNWMSTLRSIFYSCTRPFRPTLHLFLAPTIILKNSETVPERWNFFPNSTKWRCCMHSPKGKIFPGFWGNQSPLWGKKHFLFPRDSCGIFPEKFLRAGVDSWQRRFIRHPLFSSRNLVCSVKCQMAELSRHRITFYF